MAQKWRARRTGEKTAPRPLDQEKLTELALNYVGRFATSRAKLISYLSRKIRERGWEGDAPPEPDAIAERLADLRYVDDEAYAAAKSAAMLRRGLGRRRISEALRHDGVAEHMPVDVTQSALSRWEAAHQFAHRKRIGPFARQLCERPEKEKQLAAFLRAGHDLSVARQWVEAAPGDIPAPPDEQED